MSLGAALVTFYTSTVDIVKLAAPLYRCSRCGSNCKSSLQQLGAQHLRAYDHLQPMDMLVTGCTMQVADLLVANCMFGIFSSICCCNLVELTRLSRRLPTHFVVLCTSLETCIIYGL